MQILLFLRTDILSIVGKHMTEESRRLCLPLVFGCRSALALSRCTGHVEFSAANDIMSSIVHSIIASVKNKRDSCRLNANLCLQTHAEPRLID